MRLPVPLSTKSQLTLRPDVVRSFGGRGPYRPLEVSRCRGFDTSTLRLIPTSLRPSPPFHLGQPQPRKEVAERSQAPLLIHGKHQDHGSTSGTLVHDTNRRLVVASGLQPDDVFPGRLGRSVGPGSQDQVGTFRAATRLHQRYRLPRTAPSIPTSHLHQPLHSSDCLIDLFSFSVKFGQNPVKIHRRSVRRDRVFPNTSENLFGNPNSGLLCP